MPVPPLTFFKAKKIDSIRYPYGIQQLNIQQPRLHTNKATDKGSETTKGYKRTPETTKARNRRNATSNRGKGGKAKHPKKPPIRE